MAKLIKLTDAMHRTRNMTQWGPGITHSGTGNGQLCGPGWIHAYECSPTVALFLNPIHAKFNPPVVWEAEGKVSLREGKLKCGCESLTTVRILHVRKPTNIQRIAFAILVAAQNNQNKEWTEWANSWLLAKDRSKEYAICISVKTLNSAGYRAALVAGQSNDAGTVSGKFTVFAAADAVANTVNCSTVIDLDSIAEQAMEYR